MYAEIKSENKILINRPNDNEKILLESIFNKSQVENSKIIMEKLLNDTADFGGIYLTLVEGGPEEIKLNEAVPTYINLPVGDSAHIIFNTNIKNDDIKILLYTGGVDIDATSTGNEIIISPKEPQNLNTNIIYYSIEADGFKSYSGNIEVNIVPRLEAVVLIKVKETNESEEYLEDVSIIIKDKDETVIPITNEYYYLKPGDYSIQISHSDYVTYYNTFTITDEDLLVPSIEKVFTGLEKKL